MAIPKTHVEDFRVPPGHIAITIDLAGLEPATIAIPAAKLAQALDSLDQSFAGFSYQRALALFVREFRKLKRRVAVAGTELVPFWLVVRHPTAGNALQQSIADHLRRAGSVHVTLHIGRSGGVALAVGDQFVDLEASLAASKGGSVGVVGFTVVEASP
jgi:hypothetical protein